MPVAFGSDNPNFDYATGPDIVAECFSAFLPPRRISVADYAAEHRWLSNEGGGFVGRWSHAEVPYLVGPMDALIGPDHLTCAIVGPGQSAKTSVAENWLLQMVGCDPGNLLWYMQTEQAVHSYVKQRIDPMIRSHEGLRSRLGPNATDNSLGFKNFGAMWVEFLQAAESTMINKSAPRLVVDEIDAYKGLGDVKVRLDIRRQTFGRDSMMLVTSHPDLATSMSDRGWTAGVMAIYADSDRRIWYWRCPHCGAASSPNPTAARHMALDYPAEAPLDEIEQAARLVCPVNGCLIEDKHRRAMNLSGRWVGLGQEIDEEGRITGDLVRRDTAGFWIVGAMSPFILGGIGGLAKARVKAERERAQTGDDKTLRQVIVKQWGLPFEAAVRPGSLDATILADRAEPAFALRTVPDGVRFITAAIDVQANRFELLFRGWGVDAESWVIDVRTVVAEPSTDPDAWDRVLSLALDAAYPLADASGRALRVRCAGFDSGGVPGVTEQAYAAWRRLRAARRAKMMGKIAQRDVWTVLPLKGTGSPNAKRLSVVYPDTARADRRAAAKGEIPVGIFNANQFKDALAAHLGRAEPGAGAVHFPAALRSPEPPHAWFEQLAVEQRRDNGSWFNPGGRNEAMDLMVMTHVMAHLHGLSRINWTRPPAWAAEWATNPLVVDAAATPPAAEPRPRAAPPVVVTASAKQAASAIAERLARLNA